MFVTRVDLADHLIEAGVWSGERQLLNNKPRGSVLELLLQ